MEARWELLGTDAAGVILARQAELEAHGITTYVPEFERDPYFAAGGAFRWSLFVPSDALEAAREILAARSASGDSASGRLGES